MKFKENFTGLETPTKLIAKIDEDLGQELNYEETKGTSDPSFPVGLYLACKRKVEMGQFPGLPAFDIRTIEPAKRHIMKMMQEHEDFDPQRYASDNFDPEELQEN